MGNYLIYKNLAWLNELPDAEAEHILTTVSGSRAWAREMTEKRPFPMVEALFETAADVWRHLPSTEWTGVLEALDPALNDKFAATDEARLYRERFGFIFLGERTDLPHDKKLAACRVRLGNSFNVELRAAADEHRRSIERKLESLLER